MVFFARIDWMDCSGSAPGANPSFFEGSSGAHAQAMAQRPFGPGGPMLGPPPGGGAQQQFAGAEFGAQMMPPQVSFYTVWLRTGPDSDLFGVVFSGAPFSGFLFFDLLWHVCTGLCPTGGLHAGRRPHAANATAAPATDDDDGQRRPAAATVVCCSCSTPCRIWDGVTASWRWRCKAITTATAAGHCSEGKAQKGQKAARIRSGNRRSTGRYGIK